jgi:hypothetical protein
MNFPPAMTGLAGRALQPAFGLAINVTRQKIAASSPVFG